MRHPFILIAAAVFALVVMPQAAAQETLPTIAEHIASAADFSILNQLIAADPAAAAWLNQPDTTFTLLAPVDTAWQGYFEDTGLALDDLLRQPRRLNDLLRFHLVPMALPSASESGWLCRELGTMLPNERLLIEWDWDGDRFQIGQQAHTLSAPLLAANGLVYRLDRIIPKVRFIDAAGDHTPEGAPTLIPPPTPTAVVLPDEADVQTVLADDGRFTVLLSLLANHPGYLQPLNGGGLYLLFAPTDAAFEAFFRPRRALPASFEDLLLSSSILPGYLTPDLFFTVYADGYGSYCPLQPGVTVAISHTDDTITAGGAPLTGETLLARNVIIYVMDGVQYQEPFRG